MYLKRIILLTCICLISALFAPVKSFAVTLPQGFSQTQVATGLTQPVAMDIAPDGRIFVTEKGGNIRIIKNGQLVQTPFLTLSVDSYIERGLLGIAFDPDFNTNHYLYVYYTRSQSPIKNRVSRFTASTTSPDLVQENSEVVLLDDIPSDSGMHNGGSLHFGTDGKLYISVGDGGQDHTTAQSLSSLSGKILRINKDGSVPTDNPFVNTPNARGEIWTLGLRNPFSFAIHPTLGTLMIDDVGQDVWEEVNLGQKGANYGWPTCEGSCNNANFTNPIYQQYHPLMASITGASFYTGTQFPNEYKNYFFFGDYVKNFIKKLDYTNGNTVTDFATDTPSPVDIHQGPDGSIYYLSIGDGALYQISYQSQTPTPSQSPSPTPSSNQEPTPAITNPTNGDFYNAGDTISYAGTATDPEDGALPASAFAWTIIFHHATHTHPFLGPITGVKNGTFTIPQTGEASADTWFELQLKVTDSQGASKTTSISIYPHKVNLTLQSNPSGLSLTLDGQPVSTPFTTQSVVGFHRIISATSPQTQNSQTYTFTSWSDNDTQTHTIETPAADTTYTANFKGTTANGNGLLGTYFTHDNFTGTTLQRIDPTVNFHWHEAEPITGITPEYYSVRWLGEIEIPTDGTYTFYTTTDDGVRLWVNNTKVIDKWQDQSATEHNGQITLKPGRYQIRMDYYNAPLTGTAVLEWSGPGISKQIVPQSVLFTNPATSGDGLTGLYFNNLDFTGSTQQRIDPTLNFDWSVNAPISGIDADTFSVRWTGYITPQYSENYTFKTLTDDGVRLWVNENLLIDKMIDQPPTQQQGQIMLYAGIKYPITLEYYENGWTAVAKLLWQSPSQSEQIIPQPALYSW